MPNVKKGHTVHLFMLLDNEEEIKQTYWRYDYSGTPYANYNTKKMEEFIERKTKPYELGDKFLPRIRLEPRSQDEFEIIDGFVPVERKEVNCAHTVCGRGENKDGAEEAEPRFKNNLSWMGGLRDCVKWMQTSERAHGQFYDLVVRLRDDTLAYGEWIFKYGEMKGALTSADIGSYRGINDHNLVLDRKWADTLFRGLIEDYYFNGTNRNVMWNNTESRIYQVATAYDIPIKTATMCQFPLIPLRATENSTHWLMHLTYAGKMVESCWYQKEADRGCDCKENREWIDLLDSGYSAMNWPKLVT